MVQIFRHHRLCKQDGPLGPYIDQYAAEMRDERYSQQTSEKQIRVVADFGRWLGKRGIQGRRLPLNWFSRTFALEHGGSYLQETRCPLCGDCRAC